MHRAHVPQASRSLTRTFSSTSANARASARANARASARAGARASAGAGASASVSARVATCALSCALACTLAFASSACGDSGGGAPGTTGVIEGTVQLAGAADDAGHGGVLVVVDQTGDVATSAPDGRFRLSGLTSGVVTLTASRAGYVSAQSPALTVREGQTTQAGTLELAVVHGVITGSVRKEGETDQANVALRLLGTGAEVTTASDGAFTFTNVPAGTHVVEAQASGFEPTRSAPLSVVGEEPADAGLLILSRSRGSLAGMANLDGQTDHSGIFVSLQGTAYATITGPSGAYAFSEVSLGNYTVRAIHTGYEDATATDQQVIAGQITAVPALTLYVKTSSISGTVTLEQTTDHSGVSVVATAAWNPGLTRSGSTNLAGSYTISGVEPGMWHVVATKSDYLSETRENVFVQADYPTLGIDFLLQYRPAGVASDLVYVSGGSNQGDPNQTGTVGTPLHEPFVVKVLDSYGLPVPNTSVFFEVMEAKTGGQMENQLFVLTNDQGEASNRYVLGRQVGLNQVRVSATMVTGQVVYYLATGEPDLPHVVLPQHGDVQTATVGTTLPGSLGVIVHDQYGNPVPGATCGFTPSAGTATPSSANTDAFGYLQSSWTLGTTMGSQTLTVTCGAATYQFSATATHDVAAAIVKVSGDNQTGINLTTLTNPLVAEVRDQYGNPVSGAQMTFAVITGSGTLDPTAPQTTGPTGRAQTSLTLGSLGTIQVTASVSGLTPAVFGAISIAGSPSVLVLVSGGGQSGVVATQLAAPFVVRLNDNYGNPVENATLQFTPGALGGTPGSATPPSAVTGADGQASTTLTLGTLAGAGAQWVDVTVDGFPTVTLRIPADAEPDAPVSITIVSGDNQLAAYGQQLPDPLVALVSDQYSNPVWDYLVTWTSTTEGTVAPNPSLTSASGLATVTATLGSTPDMAVQDFTATANALQITFHATATGHYIDYLFPGRMWPGCPIDIEVEIFGAGFAADANVIWDAGGTEVALTPSLVETTRIVVTLPAALFDAPRLVPVAVEQSVDGRCAAVGFVLGGVLPDTGQTLCYNNSGTITCPAPGEPFYGQDAQFGWDLYVTPAQRFVRTEPVAGEPVVFDQLTRLEWQGCAAGLSGTGCTTGTASLKTWQAAVDYCEALVWGGHNDWVLPNVKELFWIVDAGRQNPSINVTAFPGTPSNWFWSSSSSAFNPVLAWGVYFNEGFVGDNDKSGPGYARCVRGRVGPPDPPRFEPMALSGDRVVRDIDTGLIWQGCAAGLSGSDCTTDFASAMTWQAALAYCDALVWGGFDDWRLPNRNELQSIVDYGRYFPPIDVTAFPGTPTEEFWSSSSGAGSPGGAWSVDFNGGYVDTSGKSDAICARCVRGRVVP